MKGMDLRERVSQVALTLLAAAALYMKTGFRGPGGYPRKPVVR